MKALLRFLKSALEHKLNRDVAWTLGSFGVLAVSGIIMNIIIALFRDASALGIFNLAYAVHLIGSQIAVFGIHLSVMRHTAYYSDDPEERGGMFLSAAVLTLLSGITAGSLLYALSPWFAPLFGSPEMTEAIRYTAYALALFPLNKVLMGYINGLRRMKALALLQSMRYVVVLFGVTAVSVSSLPFTAAIWAFFAAELLTMLVTMAYLFAAGLFSHLYLTHIWIRKHLVFGGKGAMGNILLDMNTRVDVILIGALMGPREAGIYSFAAMLVDGVQHILSMIRVNFNPVLVTAVRDRHWQQGKRLLHHTKRYVTAGTLGLSLLILAGFYILVQHILPDKGLVEGWPALIILLSGYTLISGLMPFDHLMLASGHPGYQTAQNIGVAATNVALCLWLIPKLGITGAAMATALSYITGIVIMLALGHRLLGWNLLTNITPAES